MQAIARRQGLAQLLLGRATDLTAYPIDALNSTPFIADDLSGAYGYVLARHQNPAPSLAAHRSLVFVPRTPSGFALAASA